MIAVLLSYFDALYGPKLLFKTQNFDTSTIIEKISTLIEIQKTQYFTYSFERYYTINHHFTVENLNTRGLVDSYLITILTDTLVPESEVTKDLLKRFITDFIGFMKNNKLDVGKIAEIIETYEDNKNSCEEPNALICTKVIELFMGYFEIFKKIIQELLNKEKERQNLVKFPEENPTPVLRIGRNEQIQYLNRASLKMLNFSSGERSEIVSTKTPIPEEFYQAMEKAFRLKTKIQFEFPSQGKIFFVTVYPNLEENYVNIYAIDITQQVQSQLELQHSEARWRSFADNSSSFITIINKERTYLQFYGGYHQHRGIHPYFIAYTKRVK